MASYTRFTIAALLTTCIWSTFAPARAGEVRESSAEKQHGWQLLFDGHSAQGWHSYRQDTINPQWHVEDGMLTTVGKGGGDIVTDRKFDDFELQLEWKIDVGGNSGIYYRVDEAAPVIWQLAPEMQILDDERHEDRLNPKHRAGAVYDLYAPSTNVTLPAGQFNTARIVVKGAHVEHWLNGHKVAEYDTASEDWKRRFAASKFARYPEFAASRAGRIGLQDHGDKVWFRNIKIRPLGEPAPPCIATCRTPEWARLEFYRDANAALGTHTRARVVFMGDSITQGWAGQSFIKDNPDFVGRGIAGQTTPQMLVRFRSDVIALEPAVVHIMAGTNDVAENSGPETDEEIEGYIASMVELARANAIKVVLASIPPAADFPWRPGLNPTPRIKRLNEWSKDYAARNGLVYVDYWPALATPEGAMKPEFSPDGVHPNVKGYTAMQPLAQAAIERALSEETRVLPNTRNDLLKDEAVAYRACPSVREAKAADLPAIRACQAQAFYTTPFYERVRERYRVSVTPRQIGGVYTEVFIPEEGVARQNRRRVLINLHGGGFDHGARYISRLESMPIAAVGKIEVIGIDYRMAPAYAFPAASEDVAAVYRELLKNHKPRNIGIYGCSAGGLLTAQTVAWLQKEGLPRPGAVGMFCEGAGFWTDGDSGRLDATSRSALVASSRQNRYLKEAAADDPLAFPARSAQVLAQFPPALLISGTRDFALSSVVQTHSMLVAQGVDAQLHVWEGLGHSFFLDPDLPQSREVYSVVARFFEKHLGGQVESLRNE